MWGTSMNDIYKQHHLKCPGAKITMCGLLIGNNGDVKIIPDPALTTCQLCKRRWEKARLLAKVV